MNHNRSWMVVYGWALVALCASPLAMIASRVIQVDREARLVPPAVARHWLWYPLGRRLDDQSFYAQVAAAIAAMVILWALIKLRRRHATEWELIRLSPSLLWPVFAATLTLFYVVRVYFQDGGSALFYEYGNHQTEYRQDTLMRQLQSFEGWQNIAVIWLGALFFPVAWELLRVARERGECDPIGGYAALGCLNAAVGPISLLVVFQVDRRAVLWLLGAEPELFTDFGPFLGALAMAVQLLPLTVLFVVAVFTLPHGECVHLGSLAEDWLDELSRRVRRFDKAWSHPIAASIPFLRLVSFLFIGFWYRRVSQRYRRPRARAITQDGDGAGRG